MNVYETLKFIRISKKIKQRDMLPSTADHQIYNRIETGRRKISVDELFEALNTLQVTPSEFFTLVTNYKENQIKTIDSHLSSYSRKKFELDDEDKAQLLNDYFYLNNIETKTVSELCLFCDIKALCHNIVVEIEPISKYDLHLIFTMIKNRKNGYYTYYEYRLVSNTIILFPQEKISFLLDKMFPIENLETRDEKVINIASLAFNNAVTASLHERDYKQALYYIKLGKQQQINPRNFLFYFSLGYLEDLLNYLVTGNITYLNKVYTFIVLLENTNDSDFAEILKDEVKKLAFETQRKTQKKELKPVNMRTE
ncbi:helix-turn-helix transcriptional regulator [Candidatus Enterococcus lemimoniae]|uniref:HTH cro/C1-type domain-containing protein n=1 Tax=Candidatus Enterococcus lemimoniae TaxID=1834167 RepID=A0ABZ2T615_9ENTE